MFEKYDSRCVSIRDEEGENDLQIPEIQIDE